MVYYEDLLGAKFKINGRDPETGLDCYGLVIILTKRAGVPLKDFIAEPNDTAKADDWDYYAQRLNIELIDTPEPGAIAQFIKDGVLHLVYYLDKKTIIQMTYSGVRVCPSFIAEKQNDYILMRVINDNPHI